MAVLVAGELRVAPDLSPGDAVEHVDAARRRRLQVALAHAVEQLEDAVVAGQVDELVERSGRDGPPLQLDHFEVAADRAGEDTDAVGRGAAEPAEQLVDGGRGLLVRAPAAQAGSLAAVGAHGQRDDAGGVEGQGGAEEVGHGC